MQWLVCQEIFKQMIEHKKRKEKEKQTKIWMQYKYELEDCVDDMNMKHELQTVLTLCPYQCVIMMHFGSLTDVITDYFHCM